MLEVVKSINGTPEGKEKENEIDHFFVCGQCGQAVDSRSLFQVLHHDESGHRPLGDADLTATATVSEAEQ